VNVHDLPSLDHELFATDPLTAATEALDVDFVLRAEHLGQFVRSGSAELPWSSLVAALAAARTPRGRGSTAECAIAS
jgi:hypothetical protein